MKPKYQKAELLKDYYKTEHWKKFRLSITEDKECKCEMCDQRRWIPYKRKQGYEKPKRMEIHHKEYNLYKEKRDEVLVLCSSCHQFCHQAEEMARTRGGVYQEIYDLLLTKTEWRFTRYDRGRVQQPKTK